MADSICKAEMLNRVAELEHELQRTQEHLQATIEELEAANEELLAANEELQDGNQALRAADAKSQAKIDELTILTNDFENLLRSTHIGTIFLDRELRIRKLTPAIYRTINITEQDIGRPINHFTDNFKSEGFVEHIRNVIETGEPFMQEVQDNKGAWFLERIFPFVTEKGEVNGAVVTFVDISDLKAVENALLKSEERLKHAIEISADGFWDWNLLTGETYYSPRLYETLGYSTREVIPTPHFWESLAHPEDVPKIRQRLKEHFEGKTPTYECEVRMRTKSGAYRTRLNCGRVIERDADGQPLRMIGAPTDITARKAVEEAFRASEARTRAILETTAEAIITIDSQGIIDSANPATTEMFGYTNDELVGQSVNILMPKPYRNEHDGHIENYLRTGQKKVIGIRRETIAVRKDGTVFPIDLSVSEVDLGKQRLFTGIIHDITERKEAEEEVQTHIEKLKEANRELEGFNYIVSHDLQEPTRTLKSYCTLLKDDLGEALPPDAQEDIQFIVEAADRMQMLIRDLLALSRAGRTEFRETDVRLDDCMKMVLRHLEARLEETGGHVEWSELPTVKGDAALVSSVLQNLVDNGLKFSGDAPPHVKVTAKSAGHHWEIAVKDNGMGISSEYFDEIFLPFKRLHSKSQIGGSGMGLAIVRRLVERHGGRIWVESTPGEGSVFKFTLPR